MRRYALALTLLLATFATAAHAVEIAKLGDFEDATFGPWLTAQVSVAGDAQWFVTDDGTYSPINGFPVYLPNGAWQAVSDCDGPYATGILHRTFTIPSNADTLKLRFWYRSTSVGDMPTLTPGGQGQGVRVDLMTSAAPLGGMTGILGTLFATSFPANAADNVAPRTLAIGVQSLRGQTVRLRIASMSNTAPMIAGVDDVRLEGSQYEVVASTGLPNLRDGAADWGDFDGDGDLDLALEGNDGATRYAGIYRNNGGTFTLFASAPDGFDNGDVKWLDTDHDGDLDVFFNGDRAAGIWSWVGTNTGAGFTWAFVQYDVAHSNLAMYDYDADGDADLMASSAGRIVLYRNNGAGGFAELRSTDVATLDSAFVAFDTRSIYPNFVVYGTQGGTAPYRSTFTNDAQGAGYTRQTTGSGAAAYCEVETGTALGSASLKFVSGRTTGSPALSGRVEDTYSFAAIPEDIPGLYDASAAWGDDNLDGLPDLFVVGSDNGTPYARMHRYNGSALQASSDVFTGMTRAACALGDYDNDGDLDVLMLGQASGVPTTKLYRNATTTTNAPPTAPETPQGHGFLPGYAGLNLFGLNFMTDDHTPSTWRTLNFRAGSTPGGTDLIPPDSDPVTGARRVARPGNARGANYYQLSQAAFRSIHTPIYYATQGVDQQFKGGPWSPERVVRFGPSITSVTDVPGDQGGAVRLTMTASPFDVTGSPFPARGYNIFARVNSAALAAQVTRAAAAGAVAEPSEEGGLATITVGDRRFVAPATVQAGGLPPGTWEIVASFLAYQGGTYTVRVNTVADSGASGPNWSVFVASMHTDSTAYWWMSTPDSGKSLDNIAPGAPQGVQLSYHPGTHNALSWQPSAAEDFQYFRVYRGVTPNFTISPGTLVASTADVAWTDPAPGATNVYYKVTALDHAGNESAAATPSVTTDVDGGATPAYEFALGTPSPSPFAARTAIAFTLPAAQHARLEVFDAAGRRVATLADAAFAAGPHSVTWDGSADGGTRANAGLLFVRLSSGGREAVRRVVMLGGAK